MDIIPASTTRPSLHGGRWNFGDSTGDHCQDPTLHRLSRQVEVVEDPVLSRAYPGKTASQVKLVLKDGRKFEGRIERHKGDPGNPISEAELSAKARNNCLKALGQQKSEAFITRINQLEKIPDISKLIAWL